MPALNQAIGKSPRMLKSVFPILRLEKLSKAVPTPVCWIGVEGCGTSNPLLMERCHLAVRPEVDTAITAAMSQERGSGPSRTQIKSVKPQQAHRCNRVADQFRRVFDPRLGPCVSLFSTAPARRHRPPPAVDIIACRHFHNGQHTNPVDTRHQDQ
ncbi:hypothetical protein GCM10009828_104010 [Actinoplanes couchii]|uniref:Uncharacterized protein n=1 Tax=Actinoplanes couchii TaxID=403638 RepID=A0ABQ3XLD1_9ACTN|nr:hypothetical protein Aco03nite_077050 [Actinoplanes couchii]